MSQEELLRRAFRLTRSHPGLWLLALLAGEGVGGGSLSSPGGSVSGPGGGNPPDTGLATQQLRVLFDWVAAHLTSLLLVLVIALVVLAIVGSLAAAALYTGSVELDAGRAFGAGRAWEAAWRGLAGLLAFRVLTGLAFLVPLVLMLALTVYLLGRGGSQGLPATIYLDFSLLTFYFLSAIIAWPLLLLAARAVVLERLGPLAALATTARLVAAAPVRVLITVAVAIGLGIGAGVVNGVVLALVAIPFQGSLVSALQGLDLVRIAAALLPLLVAESAFSLLAGAVIGCFYSSYWTLSYQALRRA